MDYALLGNINDINDIETSAVGNAIREVARLRRAYGPGRWRKLKGKVSVRLSDDGIVLAEVHWYEAHGKERKEIKIKRLLDPL